MNEFSELPSHVWFHETCYRKFIDKREIQRAVNKKAKISLSEKSEPTREVDDHAVHRPPKKLRSSSFSALPQPTGQDKAGPVLPRVCIICKKVRKRTSRGQRKEDRLMRAETLDGGN